MTGQAVGFAPRAGGSAADQLLSVPRQPRPDPVSPRRTGSAATVIGSAALLFSALYFLSDVIEVIQGGFSVGQLWLTLVSEAAIPIFVVGLAILSRPRLGRAGQVCAWAYGYSYVVFTGTVVYALVNHTKDYKTLNDQLGLVMIAHGAVMVLAGLGFGYVVLRRRLFPAWACVALMAGVVLVAIAQGLPDDVQLGAAGVRDLGFAGMGAALLRPHRAPPASRPDPVARHAA
jgi:hypothetical protein